MHQAPVIALTRSLSFRPIETPTPPQPFSGLLVEDPNLHP